MVYRHSPPSPWGTWGRPHSVLPRRLQGRALPEAPLSLMGPAAPLGTRQATDVSGQGAGPSGRAGSASRHSQRGTPGRLLSGPYVLNMRTLPAFSAGLATGCTLSVLLLLLYLLITGPGASPFLPSLTPAGGAGGQASGSVFPSQASGSVFPSSSWDERARASSTRALIRQVGKRHPRTSESGALGSSAGTLGLWSSPSRRQRRTGCSSITYFYHIPYGKGTYLGIGVQPPPASQQHLLL